MKLHPHRLLKIGAVAVFSMTAACVLFGQSKAPSSASASSLKVDCNKKGSIGATLAHLTQTGNTRGLAISVTGTCHEDVLIQGFDRLTLLTTTGAAIEDPSGGTNITVDIEDSRSVTLQGFTVSGGAEAVVCGNASVCYFNGNTLQSSLDSGLLVSAASSAFLQSNVVQNNGRGITVNLNSSAYSNNDMFQGNTGNGITANQGYVFASTSTVQNNGAGVLANHAAARLENCTISNNGNTGVSLQRSSEVGFDTTSVTGNGGDGVVVRDLSFAIFSTSNITGNLGGTDVSCRPQFPATRGALTDIGGGTTNCVEP